MIPEVQKIKTHEGDEIPWLAWGNGTAEAGKNPVECGKFALAAGIRHIDTAQSYKNETQTARAIRESGIPRDQIYVTSKISGTGENFDKPVAIDEIISSVQGSLDRLGFVPDLYLIHNPFVARPGELKVLWNTLEDLKDAGKLKSIGVSNFRPQDLIVILDGAKYKPVVNQIEYHPYVLTHLEPLLNLQKRHGIVTASYGALTPILRHPTGGPLKPILERIADRISKATGKKLDSSVVLLLWTRAQGVITVTASGNEDRLKQLGEIATLPDLLTQEEIDEITRVGKTIHFRHYTEHMEKNFDLPKLPKN